MVACMTSNGRSTAATGRSRSSCPAGQSWPAPGPACPPPTLIRCLIRSPADCDTRHPQGTQDPDGTAEVPPPHPRHLRRHPPGLLVRPPLLGRTHDPLRVVLPSHVVHHHRPHALSFALSDLSP